MKPLFEQCRNHCFFGDSRCSTVHGQGHNSLFLKKRFQTFTCFQIELSARRWTNAFGPFVHRRSESRCKWLRLQSDRRSA